MLKKNIFGLVLAVFACFQVFSQAPSIEQLVNSVLSKKTDNDKQDRHVAIDDSLDKTNSSKLNYYYLDTLIKRSRRLNDKHMEAVTLMTLGNFYLGTGNSFNSIEAHRKSLALFEELKNMSGMCNIYLNMGNTYFYMEDLDKAEEYYKKSIVYFDKTPNKTSTSDMKIANIYNNLGSVYCSKRDFTYGKSYFDLALKNYIKKHDSISIAYIYNNFGSIFSEKKQWDSAFYYYKLALPLKEKFGSSNDKADGYMAIAEMYNVTNKPAEAIKYLDKALNALDLTAYNRHLVKCYLQYNESYQKLNDCKNEIKYYKLYKLASDSSAKKQQKTNITKLELQFEFSKIHLSDSIKAVEEIKLKDVKLAEEKTQSYFLIFALLLTVVALSLIYSRFKLTQKQKHIIEEQKLVVDLKNKEIIESINYAKRLQDAILPGSQQLNASFAENFVFYKPKDIVAGDFYWMEVISSEFLDRSNVSAAISQLPTPNAELILIAAADCTGHGVPGAMISIACNNALHRAVTEFKNTEPGKILDETKKIISESFNKNESSIRDGMDISLLAIDKKNKSITWSGANNRLLYVQNSELLELKPDKHPIGKSDTFLNFKTNSIPYIEGTVFYLFTDGIIDQFGGKDSKKFMISNFKKLIDDNKDKPLKQQLAAIEDAYIKWKGNIEQIDDITVLAVKI